MASRRSGRVRTDDDDDFQPPSVPRNSRNSSTSNRTFPAMVPHTGAPPARAAARMPSANQEADILEQKRLAASGGVASAYAAAPPPPPSITPPPPRPMGSRTASRGTPPLTSSYHEPSRSSAKHSPSLRGSATAPGAVPVPGTMQEEEKMEERADYEEEGYHNQSPPSMAYGNKSYEEGGDMGTPKEVSRAPGVERVRGPGYNPENSYAFSPHSSAVHSEGLAVAAEIAPEQSDIEAQVQQRVHQEREEIVSQVQRQLLGQTVQADVVTPGDPDQNDKAPPTNSRKPWLIIAAIAVVLIVVVVVLVVVLVGKDDGGGGATEANVDSPPTTPPKNRCTLCADGSTPEDLDSLVLEGSDITCDAFMASQAELGDGSDACTQGQAEAWRYCSCPTLPPLSANATCSLCGDPSIPLGMPQELFDGETCSDWSTFAAHVGSSPSECTSVQADLSAAVEFCQCLTEPTFLQFLTNLLFPISGDTMLQEGTPQNDALNWLANGDPAGLTAGAGTVVLQQRYILAVLHFATAGPSWERDYGFLTATDACSWNDGNDNGVFCTSGVVTKVELDSNNLNGAFPNELAALTGLQMLELRTNGLEGTIPDNIGDLSELERFDVGATAMTGTLPSSLFTIPTLTVLWMDKASFSGSLPSTFGSGLNLEWFDCSESSLTGSIPESIGSLIKLSNLNLAENDLDGSLPSFVGNNRLTELALMNNKLTGTIPSTLGSLARIQELLIPGNSLKGTIPSSVGALPSLTRISFSGNKLSGPIPQFTSEQLDEVFLYDNELSGTLDDFFNSTASATMTTVRLEENKFTGTLPESIGNFVNLVGLSIYRNDLGGSLPSTIGNMLGLEVLGIFENFFAGTIPQSIGSLPSLLFVALSSNDLEGDIPAFTSQKLEQVWLDGNRLDGSLDDFFNSTTEKLIRVRFEDNRLSGSLPEAVGNFVQLEDIDLSNNMLTGSIPSTLGNLVNAEVVRLNKAGVTGSVPTELGRLINVKNLDLGQNDFTGTVPNELEKCTSLSSLGFALCGLTGSFPASVANLPQLEELLIHGNDFTNDFDETFCSRTDEIDRLIANCLVDTIDCSCCTSCCPSTGLNCVEQ